MRSGYRPHPCRIRHASARLSPRKLGWAKHPGVDQGHAVPGVLQMVRRPGAEHSGATTTTCGPLFPWAIAKPLRQNAAPPAPVRSERRVTVNRDAPDAERLQGSSRPDRRVPVRAAAGAEAAAGPGRSRSPAPTTRRARLRRRGRRGAAEEAEAALQQPGRATCKGR